MNMVQIPQDDLLLGMLNDVPIVDSITICAANRKPSAFSALRSCWHVMPPGTAAPLQVVQLKTVNALGRPDTPLALTDAPDC